MWPKAFSQFIELAPHISRLLPLADRFLQSKTTEDSGRRALETASAGLQAELKEIAVTQAEFARQISTLGESAAAANRDTQAIRTAIEAMEARAALAAAGEATVETRLTAMEDRLGGFDAQLQRMTERIRLSPVVLLLVLTNLLLLAALFAVLLHGR